MVRTSKFLGRRGLFTYWRTISSLIILLLATFLGFYQIWSFLLLYWVILDIKSGETYLVESINKKENKFLYWLIVGTWLVLAIWGITDSFMNKKMESGKYYNRAVDLNEFISTKRQANKEVREMSLVNIDENSIEPAVAISQNKELFNEMFKFGISIPNTWKLEEDSDDEMFNLSVYNDSEMNSLNLTIIPYADYYDIDDMVEFMTDEIQKEYYFIDYSKKNFLVDNDSLKVIDYTGSIDKYKLELTSKYLIKEDFCYVLIRLKTPELANEAKEIDSIFNSFRVAVE
jgi:hypothetical protein